MSKGIRSTRKKKNDNVKNARRFRGWGAFKDTHISFCKKKCCGAQNDSPCYSKPHKKK